MTLNTGSMTCLILYPNSVIAALSSCLHIIGKRYHSFCNYVDEEYCEDWNFFGKIICIFHRNALWKEKGVAVVYPTFLPLEYVS